MRLEDAAERADTLLRERSGSDDPDRLMITRAELRDNGWLFFYSSSAFVRSRSFLDALGGDLPILVSSDGTATAIPYDAVPGRAGEPVHPGADART
ncbi:MAG TPA: YrhB domain-containing protein [Microlunatus sp.]